MSEENASSPEERTESHIMTPKEAARYLGFHIITIYRLLKKQEIPGIKIGKQWRFRREVLDRWFDERLASNDSDQL